MSVFRVSLDKKKVQRWALLIAPIVVLFSLFVITGFRGVDFGDHWDEIPWHIQPVRDMVHNGVFLPRAYIYPSLSKWLVLLPSLPRALSAAFASHGDPVAMQAAMQSAVDASDYLLTARRVFVVVSALAIVWMYCCVLVLGRTSWEALVAACCIGLSWEYGYHARWVANDCILTQFAALTLLLLALFHRFKAERWLYLAAVSVGLGTGAKQPGVFILLPVLLASILSLPLNKPARQLGRLVALCALAFAAFVATTPGVVLDPFVFIGDARRISSVYAAGHGQFTASSPLQHWRWVLTYLSVDFFSPFHVVSIAMSACVVLGVAASWRQDRRFTILALLFPAFFLAFFCSKYVVMIARNYLLIAPFMSLFAARGVADIFARIKPRFARRVLSGVMVGVAVLQSVWLVRAGESIRNYDLVSYTRQAMEYVTDHPKTQFRVSKNVRAIARAHHLKLPENVTSAPGGQSVVILGRGDMTDGSKQKVNDPWLTDAVFGPREVNYNWYSVWGGKDRVVVMPIETARASLIAVAR
jgi:Dolichyl-phosphate-mannose-protein mannosyltransferase